MKVIIKDQFYEFQNEVTDGIFENQKVYLSKLIQAHSQTQNLEELLTALFSLYNLSEALLHKVIEENGVETVLETLKARAVE